MKKELTNRAKQAMMTKNKIIACGKQLILSKGFDNITVDAISKAADITVGTFYYYFKSKDDLLFEIMPKVEAYFASDEANKLQNAGSFEKITSYFSYFSAELSHHHSPDFLRKVFLSEKALYMLDQDRISPGVQLIREGQQKGEITSSCSAEYIAKTIFSATRGICQHWATHPDSFPLAETTRDIVERLLYTFLSDKERDMRSFFRYKHIYQTK
jgi:AcrR family transcriptional regulator